VTSLASFLLFLLLAAWAVNVFKGTGTAWLRAKFTGKQSAVPIWGIQ
jgi:hypothetical protein